MTRPSICSGVSGSSREMRFVRGPRAFFSGLGRVVVDLPTGFAAICSRSAKSQSALRMTSSGCGDVFRSTGERFRLRWLLQLKGDPLNRIYHFSTAYGETAGSATVGYDDRRTLGLSLFFASECGRPKHEHIHLAGKVTAYR